VGRTLLAIGLFLAAFAVVLTVVQRRINQKLPSTAASDATLALRAVPALRGKPVPAFELPDLGGAKVHSSDFKDKVMLVNFWATWCAPCIVEIPWFIEYQKKYGPKGLQVIGISLDETGAKDVVPFVKKHNMTYPILLGDDKIAEQFGGILGLPTTFIVDKNGKFYSMHRGLVSRESVEEELVALLGKPDPSIPSTPEENLFQTTEKNR
jgi:thiol-disulfide isomerase/thioredoxin